MKVKLIREMQGDQCAQFLDGKRPAGTVIDDPEAYLLVQLGVAIPVDEEATRAAGMSELQMNHAQRAYQKVSLGIHPEDYERFDSGEMAGYYADGSEIPGPNATVSEGGIFLTEEDDE